MLANTAVKLVTYPSLSEMGITRFHEISSYALRQEGADKDVLRVIYKRGKGSLLPYSRKYKFGRSQKTVIADGGTARMVTNYVISPFLLKAVAELDALVKLNSHNSKHTSKVSDIRTELLAEMNELAQLIREAQCDDRAIVSKLVSVRQRIEEL